MVTFTELEDEQDPAVAVKTYVPEALTPAPTINGF